MNLRPTVEVPLGGPMGMSMYLFTRDELTYHILYLYAADPPADRWLDIATSFEFLGDPTGALGVPDP